LVAGYYAAAVARSGLFIVRLHRVQESTDKCPILNFCKFGFCDLLVAILDLEREFALLALLPQKLHIRAIGVLSKYGYLYIVAYCLYCVNSVYYSGMIISLLFSEPTLFFLWLLAIVYGITVHEFSHVLAAYLQGDDTGRLMGRLTLNPAAHIEPFGMLLLLIVGFGWGRPAPFNPHNLKYRRWGEVGVALAGPASNLISIVIFGLLIKFLIPYFGFPALLPIFYGITVPGVLVASNLLMEFLFLLIFLNAVLMIFNLIPIPPLDGSKLLFEVLPSQYQHIKNQLAHNGPWILLLLIIGSNIFGISVFGFIHDFSRWAILLWIPGVS